LKTRSLLVLGGITGIALLVTAFCLSPNPNGFGTHQQLGFSPCTVMVVFGIPCPSCGMTTSWAHLTQGSLIQAFQSNAGGTLLGLSTLVLSPWSLVSGLLGRWWISPPDLFWGFYGLLGITIVTVVQWVTWIRFFPS
jgi:hypothetical protein